MRMTECSANNLLDPNLHRDSCGFGLIANLDDLPSHWVVETAIEALARLTHRGAVAADGKTGDGCGLLIKFPEAFLRSVGEDLGFHLNKRFAAGTVFFSEDPATRDQARATISGAIGELGVEVVGWREVPIDPSACGEQALATLPHIEQVFVNAPEGMPRGSFNRKLFLARRRAEKGASGQVVGRIRALERRSVPLCWSDRRAIGGADEREEVVSAYEKRTYTVYALVRLYE